MRSIETIAMNKINSLELTLDAINHRSPNLVPFSAPIILSHAAKLRGIPQKKIHKDAKILAETVLYGLERYDLDGIYVSSDNHILSEAMGSTVRFPEEGYPDEPKPLLSDSLDLSKLSPVFPSKDGRLPLILEATERVLEDVGETHFVEVCIDFGP